jgi:hypothetical protein
MVDSVKTPMGILSYPNLIVPKPPAEGAEPRYSCVIVFDEEAQKTEAFKLLKAACAQVAQEKWGANIPKNLRTPFRPCSEKEGEPFASCPGGVFISPWSKQKPGIVGPDLAEVLVADDIWAGQIVRASVRPFAYENTGNKGVSFGLGNLQITKPNMPRIDGRKSAKAEFDAVEDLAEAADSDMF